MSDYLEPLRLGMVGGGIGAFIGGIHQIAMRIDDSFKLVAGALSSSADRAMISGRKLGLPDDRNYSDYQAMADAESGRADGIQVVSIVTPNYMHGSIAECFLKAGIHVICDKPMTATLEQAESLMKVVEESDRQFVVTYNYTGYSMVRQARQMVHGGQLGKVQLIQVEYLQDWLTESLEDSDHKQARWRTNPAQSGGGSICDIGSHAYNLACFISGLEVHELSAELTSFGKNRAVDDNAYVQLRFIGGARGSLWTSQVAPGNENALRIRIYGDKGGLEWEQEDPNQLWFSQFPGPKLLITRGSNLVAEEANRVTRVPAGHPEGYLEGFATLYREVAQSIRLLESGQPIEGMRLQTAKQGLVGMQFINACQRSSSENGKWVGLDRF